MTCVWQFHKTNELGLKLIAVIYILFFILEKIPWLYPYINILKYWFILSLPHLLFFCDFDFLIIVTAIVMIIRSLYNLFQEDKKMNTYFNIVCSVMSLDLLSTALNRAP